jgi:TctA family transporter
VVTCIDGHAMAKNGRAGHALAISAIGSFFAGTVCTLIIAFAAPPLAEVALKFGAPEYFSLMVFGLIASAVLARGSLLKALGMIVVGLLFGIVGTDVNSGMSRFTFGMPGLSDGIGFVVIAMAFFGLGEILLAAVGGGEAVGNLGLTLFDRGHDVRPTEFHHDPSHREEREALDDER